MGVLIKSWFPLWGARGRCLGGCQVPGRVPGEGGAPEAKVIPRTEERFRARISLEVRRPVPAADFLGETWGAGREGVRLLWAKGSETEGGGHGKVPLPRGCSPDGTAG